jgi:hypothetical protein
LRSEAQQRHIDARPKTLADLLTLLQAPEEGLTSFLVGDISQKKLQHFMNFARPKVLPHAP